MIRTLKSRIYKLLTRNNTWRYIDTLGEIIEGYNQTPHSTTKFAPTLVDESNRDEVFKNIYGEKPDLSKVKLKFHLGDEVRIATEKSAFDKSFTPQFGDEIFTVNSIKMGEIPRYILKDIEGEILKGSFYAEELYTAALPPGKHRELVIESVLKRRTRNKVKELFVHWRGHSKKSDSWIRADSVHLL